jgi:hypothetical protein
LKTVYDLNIVRWFELDSEVAKSATEPQEDLVPNLVGAETNREDLQQKMTMGNVMVVYDVVEPMSQE